jgi:uncharacterized membrane protein YczE
MNKSEQEEPMTVSAKRPLKSLAVRVAIVIVSCFFLGFGGGVMRASCLGNDPITCFSFSISAAFGMPISLAMPAVNLALFIVPLLFKRDQIGIGTICAIFMPGQGARAALALVTALNGGALPSYFGFEAIPVRLLYYVIAMTIICIACAFYMGAAIGVGPYDSLAPVIEERTDGRIPFRIGRIITDTACAVGAILLLTPTGTQWQVVGLGTIFMAFGFGPIVDFAIHKVSPLFPRFDARLSAASE